jgi:hypothetical protein
MRVNQGGNAEAPQRLSSLFGAKGVFVVCRIASSNGARRADAPGLQIRRPQ